MLYAARHHTVGIDMRKRALIFAVVSMITFAFLCSNSTHAKVDFLRVDFCELTSDPARFQGRRVSLTAFLRAGEEYSGFLSNPGCKERPVRLLWPDRVHGWKKFDRIPARYASFLGPVFVEIDGIFAYRTDVNPEEENPFSFCPVRLRNAIGADWDADNGVAYKVYKPLVVPARVVGASPCE